LAEVLVTLGIIGVVAAMTMPVLISNINDKVLDSQKKKVQSVLANGIKMHLAQEEVSKLNDSSLYNCQYNRSCLSEKFGKIFKIISDTNNSIENIEYTFESNNKEVWSNTSKIVYTFVGNDGVIYGLLKPDNVDDTSLHFVVDVNGLKRPNTGGKDLCKYSVSNMSTLSENCEAMNDFDFEVCSLDNLDACTEENECLALSDECWRIGKCGDQILDYIDGACVFRPNQPS